MASAMGCTALLDWQGKWQPHPEVPHVLKARLYDCMSEMSGAQTNTSKVVAGTKGSVELDKDSAGAAVGNLGQMLMVQPPWGGKSPALAPTSEALSRGGGIAPSGAATAAEAEKEKEKEAEKEKEKKDKEEKEKKEKEDKEKTKQAGKKRKLDMACAVDHIRTPGADENGTPHTTAERARDYAEDIWDI